MTATIRNASGDPVMDRLLAVLDRARTGQPPPPRRGNPAQVAETDRQCDHCGLWFTPTRRDAAYCHNSCRQAAYRRRTQKGTNE